MRPLKAVFAHLPVRDFGPLALKAVRAEMIKPKTVKGKNGRDRVRPGWCRTYANRQVARLKHVFKWGTENELVPPEVYQRLATVAGLREGRCDARETDDVKPVADADVDAILPFVSPVLQAMVKLHRLTGMRSSEVCGMTTGAVDRTGSVWVYRQAQHKTLHHGHTREVFLNAEAQEMLRPFLKLDPAAFLFSPAESEAWRHKRQRQARRTPVQPSQVRRAQRAGRGNRKREPGIKYTWESYRKAVARACRKAGVEDWHPHRLRHSFATRVRRDHGFDIAQLLLGHRSPKITAMYAEVDRAKALAAVAAG